MISVQTNVYFCWLPLSISSMVEKSNFTYPAFEPSALTPISTCGWSKWKKVTKYGGPCNGRTFNLNLKSFKITDLIKVLKEYFNYNGLIKKIGIRPGEKIHEYLINSQEIPRTFKFENMYIIKSQIEKYQKSLSYDYLKGKMSVYFEKDYSSENFLIEKDEIKDILIENKIIK